MSCSFLCTRSDVDDEIDSYEKSDVKKNGEEYVAYIRFVEQLPLKEGKSIQIHFRNGKTIELTNDVVFIKELINKAAAAIGAKQKYFNCYALIIMSRISDKMHYLHPDLSLDEIEKTYCNNKILINEWKFIICVRYAPFNYEEVFVDDPITVELYYYEMVATYIAGKYNCIDAKIVAKLCSLQMQLVILKKKKKKQQQYVKRASINMEAFIPLNILGDIKPDHIRKLNKNYMKQFKKYDEMDCMRNFLDILRKTDFETFYESFNINYGCGVPVPTVIVIGSNIGILNKVTGTIINYEDIEGIESMVPMSSEYGIVLHLSSSQEKLIISSNDSLIIDKIITLIDGYIKLNLNKPSVWIKCPYNTKNVVIDTDDYSQPADRNYEINENNLEMTKKIATGKFSEIYVGYYKVDGENSKKVAIKVCNLDVDSIIKEMFVEEAYMLHRFENNHIVKLIGISSGKRPSIVTEFAEHGSLYKYLHGHKFNLGLSTLLLYAYQLSLALQYLETLRHVHKNVASENVLVFSPTCVKLSGFEILTFSVNDFNNKLPIRWMAPESITYNNFIQSSTVWSYGVCVWEILTKGIKPYENICDNSVLLTIQSGERLKKPSLCPQKLYQLLMLCWEYEPANRPKFRNIKDIIYEIYLDSRQDNA